jgi:hypothetical protein
MANNFEMTNFLTKFNSYKVSNPAFQQIKVWRHDTKHCPPAALLRLVGHVNCAFRLAKQGQ